MCVCVCVCVCVYISVFAVYIYTCIYLYYMFVQIRTWSCLVTDNFGLVTEIAVCKFLRGFAVMWPEKFLFCPLYVFIHFLHFFVRRIVP